ncbi:MAG: GAF domain-containing protein, partial [Polyangiales bacterium]
PRRDAKPGQDEGLLAQRDDFIQTFFKKGAALTEELLAEDEKLRQRLRDLEADNTRLRSQLASDQAIRELLTKIEGLEREKNDLLSRFRDAKETGDTFARRFADIEAENAKLASLYVASYQLHSTLDLPSVLRRLKELLAQFVGAAAYAIYLVDESRDELVPIASEGVVLRSLSRVRRGDGVIGEAFASGCAQWTEDDATRGNIESPAACVPLRLDERPVGLIAVFATFEQKPSFVELDFELFQLLGAHAASAIAAARLFGEHGAEIGTVSSIVDSSPVPDSETSRGSRS